MSHQPDWIALPPDVDDALRRLLHLIRSAPPAFAGAGRDGSTAENDDATLAEIASWLYASWYTEEASQQTVPALPGRAELASALAVSVASSGQWENGWVVLQNSPHGDCVASRGNVTRALLPGQFANTARPGIAPHPGDALAVIELVEWVDHTTGFWHMLARAGEPAQPLMRVYWNVDWPHVGHVLRRMTAALDENSIRYALKCPFRAAEYRRVDTMVVYIERALWEEAKPVIVQVAGEIAHQLRKPTPPLTRPIGPGVAWSEDPDGSSSFGESRCRALAPAVLSLLRNSTEWSDDTGLQQLTQSLRDAHIDPRQPWLAPQL